MRLLRRFHFLVYLAAVLPACHKKTQRDVTPERRADRTVVLRPASEAYVKAEPAGALSSSRARGLVGQIAFDERHLATLGSPVQGRVSAVNVVVGDRVTKGQVLLTIHAPDIATARAQLAQARTVREVAERNSERAALLAEKGAGSSAERLQAVAALAQARTEEDRAQSSLVALDGGLGRNSEYQLRSPIAGIVVERNVAVGSEVRTDQDQPVVKVADLSTVWVTADIYEQDLARVHEGDEATVEVVALPGRTLVGHIVSVGHTVDAQTRVARARLELQNPDLSLRPGMFANVQVKGIGEGVVEIPLGAVLARRDQFFVFVRQPDGAFHEREVRVGEQRGQHIAILSGLKPGDPVVTEGAILLDAEANEAL